ncbi:MAG TPA: DNA polymerase III subunit beta [Chloroflexus aurantiacus]|uniref:Beta sliding clamp n=1 Tax=Chloroflexus aurantiacus (strain ATCC 29366 / DSM 635 / J-10-fl) TaxID=324602 RepID=A9WIW8_CHLAA|nr:DNA polymerase III subunit beta [Chloroflexus aurantiacus]ABY35845.1 DNA polymerase III, beta subunit [Chloroflexus aurantiacus J-10-fl]HBW69288.1 DNA polymerase III subunit beta [Chloroflexus aurantiacus]
MKLTCMQEDLKRGLAAVGHAVAGKSTLPVLANILLATDEGRLKLTATNLEVGINRWISATITRDGAVAVPAKLLTDVVGGLPNDKVTLSLDQKTQTLRVECGRFVSNIKGVDADEFPSLPTVSAQTPLVSLPAEVWQEAIDQVAFAAATDESRPILTGVLVRTRDQQVTLVAADGFRLAMRTIQLSAPVAHAVDCLIPARTLSELARIIGDTDAEVAMVYTPGGSHVLFHTENIEVVSRLIEGRFPDFERIIPQQYLTRMVLDNSELAKAVKLASFFAGSSQNVVKLKIEPASELAPGRVVISANAAELGDNTSELDGSVTGEGGVIALNVRFLADAIAAVHSNQIAFEMQSAQSPAVFKPVGQDGYIHIVMPMSMR